MAPRETRSYETDGDQLRQRLAGIRDPAEVVQILGRRRLLWYAFCFITVGLAFAGFGVYLIVRVMLGRSYGWTLAMLPACLSVTAFSGLVGYAMAYGVLTGRKWSGAAGVDRFFGTLNNTYVWPRRR